MAWAMAPSYHGMALCLCSALISAATADQACSMATLPDTKCTHVPFARSTEASADACCAVCSSNSRCRQWSYHEDDSESPTNCDLGDESDPPRKPTKGITCGVKPAPTPSPGPPPPPAPPATPVHLNFSWAVLPKFLKMAADPPTGYITAVTADFQLLYRMMHGNAVDSDAIVACRLVKQANASRPCLFYLNTEKILNSTAAAQFMIKERPSWLLRDDNGTPVFDSRTQSFCPDYRNAAAGQYYLSACVNATKSGVVDGCYLDSAKNFNEVDPEKIWSQYNFSGPEEDAFVRGKRASLQQLQRDVDGKVLFPHCATCLEPGKTCGGMSGQGSQHFDVNQETVDQLQLMGREGKAFLVYSDGSTGLSCADNDQRGSMLATFLIGAAENFYFNCGPNCDNNKIYPEFTKPLGMPLGDAHAEGDVLMRKFTYGAVAKFKPGSNSTARGKACIVWADGMQSGVCP